MGKEWIDINGNHIVVNGGEFLPNHEDAGVPASWEDAKTWQENVNKGRNRFSDPTWNWDCGYKLDFDGPLVSISSRFYPPTRIYGPGWDGTVTLIIGGYEERRRFEADTLYELRKQVTTCVNNITDRLLLFVTRGTED